MVTPVHRLSGVGEALPQSSASGQRKHIKERTHQPISQRGEDAGQSMALSLPPAPAGQELPRHGDRHMGPIIAVQGIEDHRDIERREMVGDQQ